MRQVTTVTDLYKFEELTEVSQDKAVQNLLDINVDHDWWESTYDDANAIGLKINGFDIDRGNYCKGAFTEDGKAVALKILTDHGETCETYKTASKFLEDLKFIEATVPVVFDEGTEDEYEDYSDRDSQIEDLEADFLKSLCEDYLVLLRNEYEYLTSKEAIIETIVANDYEFTEDGKLCNL